MKMGYAEDPLKLIPIQNVSYTGSPGCTQEELECARKWPLLSDQCGTQRFGASCASILKHHNYTSFCWSIFGFDYNSKNSNWHIHWHKTFAGPDIPMHILRFTFGTLLSWLWPLLPFFGRRSGKYVGKVWILREGQDWSVIGNNFETSRHKTEPGCPGYCSLPNWVTNGATFSWVNTDHHKQQKISHRAVNAFGGIFWHKAKI